MASWTKSLIALLALAASLRAAPLAFRWSSEISEALPFAANAMQGETFGLVAEALQYGAPLTGEASATFYWQTPDMEASSWYAQPAQWDADAATASVTWTPKMDVGSSAYRFFFCVSSEAGKNYRLYGTIRLKPSPGFDPAALEPVDVRDEIAAEITADVIGEIDGRYLSEESDPTVPTWAKAPEKPAYTASEVGAAPESHTHAVSDVDGLQAALDEKQPAGDYAHISGDWTEPDEIVIPEHVRLAEIFGDKLRLRVTDMSQSDLLFVFDYFDDTGAISRSESCNVYQSARVDELLAGHTHSQYLTEETDPTVPAWAKAASKPAYAWSEITGKPATYAPSAHTHAISGVEGLQTAIDAKAPLSAVSMTEGGTDYVWVWDPNVGTFALTAGGAAPVYPSED